MQPRPVHVLVFDSLADWEIGHTLAFLHSGQFQPGPPLYRVCAVGRSRAPVTTQGGLTIVPEVTLSELRPGDSALLLLPGGAAWDRGELDDVARLAREWAAAGVPVAAICGATAGLARVGLLDDRAHTSNAREYLAATGYAGGDHYRDAPAVTDRGVITANTTAPVDLARHVFAALGLFSEEVLAAWYGLFRTGEPHHYAALMRAASGG